MTKPMMAPVDNILETVGDTPLVKLNRLAAGLPVTIYAKVETFNPGGSIKDRIALNMVTQAEKAGLLKPGGTIIEATAGNTGAGLALVAAQKGYRCIFVLPDKMSQEKVNLLKAYGAEVVITPTSVAPDSAESYNGVADKLAREIPNAFRPGQFSNPHNPETHELTTGPEIWDALDGKIDAFVAGMGTGGTISGIGRYLKSKNPAIKIVGADPEGSILSGDTPKSYKVEGIGEDFIPLTFDRQAVDEMVRVSDQESFLAARRLAREEGILVGGSAGTAMAGAIKYAQQLPPGSVMVVLFPDTGRNYLTKCFSDEWMAEQGFLDAYRPEPTVADYLKSSPLLPLHTVEASDSIQKALAATGADQGYELAVVKQGQVVGRLCPMTLMSLLRQPHVDWSAPVASMMGQPLPMVSMASTITEVVRRFMVGYDSLLVGQDGVPQGVVSKVGVVQFLAAQQCASASK